MRIKIVSPRHPEISMAAIYCLETDGLIWYVGSTTNLERRWKEHRLKANKGIGASLIPDEYEYTLRVLEQTTIEKRLEREQHYYDLLNPLVNVCRPGQKPLETYAAYWAKNKEKRNAQKRAHYAANPEAKRAYNREYMRRKRSEMVGVANPL